MKPNIITLPLIVKLTLAQDNAHEFYVILLGRNNLKIKSDGLKICCTNNVKFLNIILGTYLVI